MVSTLAFVMFWICILLTGFGLYKPTWVIWWELVQNRRKVIYIYGLAGVIFLGLYLILILFQL